MHRSAFLRAALLLGTISSATAETFVVNNVLDSGAGSLRQAITDANAHQNGSAADSIHFNIPGAGVPTIVLASMLPNIIESVFIDGWSQPGFQTKPVIELTTVSGTDNDGLRLMSNFITVRGLILNHFRGGIFIGPFAWAAIQGCYIGTDQTGTLAAPNQDGIVVSGGSHCLIGGSGPGAGNLISGNAGMGVFFKHQTFSGTPDITPQFNTIQGNFIGTDVTGSAAVPNQIGIYSSGFSNFGGSADIGHRIGGTISSARNVISGNLFDGIKIDLGIGLRIQGNRIGTGADGVTPLGNKGSGIQIVEGALNIIGAEAGPNLDAANTIGYNGRDSFFFAGEGAIFRGAGILFLGGAPSTPIRDRVSANSIHDNVELGVDLSGDGVTPNDPDNENVGQQNFPEISDAFGLNGQLTIYGSLNSIASANFTLEFFANQAADSLGYGEGQVFLGQASVTTNSSGDALFNVTFPLPPNVTVVAATAIGPNSGTSEFSAVANIVPTAPTAPPIGPTAVLLPTRADQLLNLSTRLRVGTGDEVMIGGFIVSGTQPKKIIVRGIGPSLAASNVPGFLADPTLDLYDASNQLLQSNDNWKQDQQAEIEKSGVPPANDFESAIVRTVPPGNYTAVLRGQNNTAGIGLVEVYDLDQAASSHLGNVSTRGFVGTANDVMISGFIAGGSGGGDTTVAIRGLGPSLASAGITNFLTDPTLELHDASGTVVQSNDDWGSNQRFDEIRASGLAPENSKEAMILFDVSPGNYTAILRGGADGTRVGLVEVYNLR
jgi:hypothetical protein